MTKNTSRPIALLAAGLLWAGLAQAQESTNASGGDATGSGGTVAYSVGQVVYTTNTGTNGSVAQGVQQSFEIYTTAGIEELDINLELSAYPNPTTDFLTLSIGNDNFGELTYQLIDLQGKLIETKPLTSNSKNIRMENLPKSTYFLKVSNHQTTLKTFKIIKN